MADPRCNLRIQLPGRDVTVRPAVGKRPPRYTPDKSLVLGKLIGHGSQGKVHMATVVAAPRAVLPAAPAALHEVAVKVMPRHSAQAIHETAILTSLPRHRNVVGVPEGLAVQYSDDEVFIPLSLASTDLLEVLLANGRMGPAEARRTFAHVVAGVAHCHAHGVYHLDIKPENILLTNGVAQLADFGSAYQSSATPARAAFPSGSITNASPEVLRVSMACEIPTASDSYDTEKADVWSLGVLLFIMAVGRPPWTEPSKRDRLYRSMQRGAFQWPQLLSHDLTSLLARMLDINPATRASLSEVMQHPWLVATHSAAGRRHRRSLSASSGSIMAVRFEALQLTSPAAPPQVPSAGLYPSPIKVPTNELPLEPTCSGTSSVVSAASLASAASSVRDLGTACSLDTVMPPRPQRRRISVKRRLARKSTHSQQQGVASSLPEFIFAVRGSDMPVVEVPESPLAPTVHSTCRPALVLSGLGSPDPMMSPEYKRLRV